MPLPRHFTRRALGYYLCATAIVMCTLWFNHRMHLTIRSSARDLSLQDWGEEDFSYVADDYPATLLPPQQHPRNVALITEETVHYWPQTPQDWESMTPTGSGGLVRLGPQKRPFGVAMYYQLHCLRLLQHATISPNSSRSNPSSPVLDGTTSREVHLCLNYLRQMLLCAANVRLEPLTEDRALGGLKTDGIGLEHRCRDWTAVRRKVEANVERWRSESESEKMP